MKSLKTTISLILLVGYITIYSIGCKGFDERTRFNTNFTNRVSFDSLNTEPGKDLELISDTLTFDFVEDVEDHNSVENKVESVQLVNVNLEIDNFKSPNATDLNFLKDIKIFLRVKGHDEILLAQTDSIPEDSKYFELLVAAENDFEERVKTNEFVCRIEYHTKEKMVKDSAVVMKITGIYLVDTKKFGI